MLSFYFPSTEENFLFSILTNSFFKRHCKNGDPARIRTWNLLIRSQTPYPLGHEADTYVPRKASVNM